MSFLTIYLTGMAVVIPAVMYAACRTLEADNQRRRGARWKLGFLEKMLPAGILAVIAGICWMPLLVLILCFLIEKWNERL